MIPFISTVSSLSILFIQYSFIEATRNKSGMDETKSEITKKENEPLHRRSASYCIRQTIIILLIYIANFYDLIIRFVIRYMKIKSLHLYSSFQKYFMVHKEMKYKIIVVHIVS